MANAEQLRRPDPLATLTRRTFIGALIGGGLYTISPEPVKRQIRNAITVGVNEWSNYPQHVATGTPAVKGTEVPQASISAIEVPHQLPSQERLVPTKEEVQHINRTVSLPLFSNERFEDEQHWISNIKTPRDVNVALWAVHLPVNRAVLRNTRYDMRQSRTPGLTYLDNDRVQWAKEMGMHPETLGLVRDFYPELRKTFASLYPEADFNTFMMGPGTGAMLMHMETGGLTNIGTKLAMTQINEASWPGEKNNLAVYIGQVNKDFGTKYDPYNIPGSAKGEEDSSGGAIGSQAMPSNARSYSSFYRNEMNLPFNLFDPYTSFEFAWLFVARKGYMRGNTDKMYNALMGWNPSDKEMKPVFGAGISYSDRFINNISIDY